LHPSFRRFASLLIAVPAGLAFASGPARADDAGANSPCGTFDFTATGGFNCKIEVSGGCTADCKFLEEELACAGQCKVSADTTCVNNCGTQCVAQCDPAHLDCFVGCHNECDGPTTTECQQKNPQADCVNLAKAQCDNHCNESCKIPPSNCQEHCNKCCTGSCTTQINFDCDATCFFNTDTDCKVQCTQPSGAIFCNGKYVHASDIQACIDWLATENIKVDVSARGSLTCDSTGCKNAGSVSGCAASPLTTAGMTGWIGVGILATAAGIARARRRRSRA
jgi:hypothetical protein